MASKFWTKLGDPSVLRRAIVIVAALAGVVFLMWKTELVQGEPSLVGTASTSLLLVFASSGWGALLERLVLRSGERSPFGLRVVWGLAVPVAIGGFLGALGLADLGAVRALLALGLLLGVWRISEPGALPTWTAMPRLWQVRRAELLGGGGIVLLALIRCGLVQGARGEGYRWDDAPAYLVFVKQLAQTGSMTQPFCLRRVTALGGQTLLQLFQAAGGDSILESANVFDWGTCSLVLVLLVLSVEAKSPSARAMRLIGAFLAVTLPFPHVNTAAGLSGVVFLLGAWRTDMLPQARPDGRIGKLAVPVLLAVMCTLRNNYAVVCGLYLLLRTAAFAADEGRRKLAVRDGIVAGLVIVAVLSPWMFMSYRLFGTPIYPLTQGYTFAEATGLTSLPTLAHRIVDLFSNATYAGATFTPPILALLLVAFLFRRRARGHDPVATLLVASMASFLFQLWKLPSVDSLGHARYAFAYVAAPVLAIVATAGRHLRFRSADVALCIVATAVHLGLRKDEVGDAFVRQMKAHLDSRDPYVLPEEATARDMSVLAEAKQTERYAALQKTCAAGETILSFLEEPFRLDFKRNRILVVDFPGALGKGGAPPVLESPADVASYFRARGVRYVAFDSPEMTAGLYGRREWERHQTTTDLSYSGHKLMARYWLGAIRFMDGLPTLGRVVFSDASITVVDVAPR